jgi:penicillin-binding protein 1A
MFDGGFAMGENLPLVQEVQTRPSQQVTTTTGATVEVGPNANFGTLSSGGLY